jgi:hypothetical protein
MTTQAETTAPANSLEVRAKPVEAVRHSVKFFQASKGGASRGGKHETWH